jgi:hypothetical protein
MTKLITVTKKEYQDTVSTLVKTKLIIDYIVEQHNILGDMRVGLGQVDLREQGGYIHIQNELNEVKNALGAWSKEYNLEQD